MSRLYLYLLDPLTKQFSSLTERILYLCKSHLYDGNLTFSMILVSCEKISFLPVNWMKLLGRRHWAIGQYHLDTAADFITDQRKLFSGKTVTVNIYIDQRPNSHKPLLG